MAITTKQIHFARIYARSGMKSESAEKAGYSANSARTQAARLLHNDAVCAEIDKELNKIRRESLKEIEDLRIEHRRIAVLAELKGDLATATRNIEDIGKTYAAYTDNINQTAVSAPDPLSDSEIKQLKAQAKALQGPVLAQDTA